MKNFYKRFGWILFNKSKFEVADHKINILAISTSEIKISVLIDKKYTEEAVKCLHKAYKLREKK